MKPASHSPMAQMMLSLIGLSFVAAVILTIPARADLRILYAAPTAQGNGDCSSWDNACTLQHALSSATEGDEIWVQRGIHKPTTASSDRTVSFSLKNNVAIYGGFAGTETSRDQRNWQTNITVLSGDIDGNDITDPNGVVTTTTYIQGNNSYHVISTTNVISTAVLDGFVVTAGQANDDTWPHSNGGGMLNNFSRPTLRNIIFSGNTAFHDGSGMFNYQSSPILRNVTFSGNTATWRGGGMFNDRSSPTLVNVIFGGNKADNGGGMYNYFYSNPTLRNAVFSGNTANSGGGMYNDYNSSPTLVNVTFGGNTAGSGGGMYNYNNSSPTLVNVTFGGNTADNGGGMYNVQSSPMLTNVIMWHNSTEISNNGDANPTIAYSNIRSCVDSASWDDTCGSDGGHNIDVDPLFVDLANGNLRLQKGSPCIDTGSNAALPLDITIDLDGNPRITDGDEDGTPVVDMGAYEVQPPPPTLTPIPTTAPTTVPTTAPPIIPTTVITPPRVYLPAVRR